MVSIFSLPLPLSAEDDKALADITPDLAWLGIWLDVVVIDTNVYEDDYGNGLNYVADLIHRKQGIGEKKFIIYINY